jgi:hypothetical protein
MAGKRKTVMFAGEMDRQDSPVLALMEYYGAEMTRDEYLATNCLGGVESGGTIPDHIEETLPEQFRRATLSETPSATEEVQ